MRSYKAHKEGKNRQAINISPRRGESGEQYSVELPSGFVAKIGASYRVTGVSVRLKTRKGLPAPEEAKFVRNGKAEVQVWLFEKSAVTINQLKELGFEVVLDPESAKMIIGRVPLEKLEALARLKFVRYLSPQVAAN
ncbi:MAG: hypothetical protein ACR2H4_14190 [Pyrinomonadaceae bacterium]